MEENPTGNVMTLYYSDQFTISKKTKSGKIPEEWCWFDHREIEVVSEAARSLKTFVETLESFVPKLNEILQTNSNWQLNLDSDIIWFSETIF